MGERRAPFVPNTPPPQFETRKVPDIIAERWAEHDARNAARAAGLARGADEDQAPNTLPLIDMSAWIGCVPPDQHFAWGEMIPIGYTTMLTGEGGLGKSLFSQILCTCMALGLNFLGQKTRGVPTLYLTTEDDAGVLWHRQDAICKSLGLTLEAVIGKLHLVSLVGEIDCAFARFDADGRMITTERWRQLEATAHETGIGFVALDNATDLMAGDHSDVHEVAAFVQLLTGFAIRTGGASLIVHHPNKAGADWLGSVAWHNKVRSRLIMKRDEVDHDARILTDPKANYARGGNELRFRWHRGAFVREQDLPSDVGAEIAAVAQHNAENEAFLKCLAKSTDERRATSVNRTATNYAPKLFAKMTSGKGISQKGYEGAMERLLHLGIIRNREPVYQYDNRTWAHGLALAPKSAQSLAQTPAQSLAQGCTEA